MQLDPGAIEWAINSLHKHADTDLFPRLVEIDAIADILQEAVDKISKIDLRHHKPGVTYRRFIIPKDDLSYRVATQLDPIDSIILTALIYQYGQGIERRRPPEDRVFSYRFNPTSDGDLWSSNDAWNAFWSRCQTLSNRYDFALIIDIADFYNQIYHHTLDNQLHESQFPKPAYRWIRRLITQTTARVSRGIPIGPHATHLLAEASLIPIDNMLTSLGIEYCRYVDDIVVFCRTREDAKVALYRIAETLDKQQRLQIQKGKVKIMRSFHFASYCRTMMEDRPINDLEKNLLDIIRKYSKGEPYRTVHLSEISEEDLRAFTPEVIHKILSDYLTPNSPDFIRLRWFLRRLAQVGHPAAVHYILDHFDKFVPALSEVSRYFIFVSTSQATLDWRNVGDRLLTHLDSELVRAIPYVQLSIYALFGANPELDHLARLIRSYSSAPEIAKREIILAAAKSSHVDWLRELKEEFARMDPWTRRAYLYASHRLPPDERKAFLGMIEPQNVLEELLILWSKSR